MLIIEASVDFLEIVTKSLVRYTSLSTFFCFDFLKLLEASVRRLSEIVLEVIEQS